MERLIMEEYLLFQSALWMQKSTRRKEKGISFRPQGPFYKKFMKNLRFELTDAQKSVISEIPPVAHHNSLSQQGVPAGSSVALRNMVQPMTGKGVVINVMTICSLHLPSAKSERSPTGSPGCGAQCEAYPSAFYKCFHGGTSTAMGYFERLPTLGD